MLLSGVFMALQSILAKSLPHFPLFLLLSFRALTTMALLLLYSRFEAIPKAHRSQRRVIIKFCLMGLLYGVVYLGAIRRLPLAEAVLFLNVGGLFNGIWGWLLAREIIRRREVGILCLMLAGLFVIVRPWEDQLPTRLVGCGMGIMGAMVMSLSNTLLRVSE